MGGGTFVAGERDIRVMQRSLDTVRGGVSPLGRKAKATPFPAGSPHGLRMTGVWEGGSGEHTPKQHCFASLADAGSFASVRMTREGAQLTESSAVEGGELTLDICQPDAGDGEPVDEAGAFLGLGGSFLEEPVALLQQVL